MNLSALNNGLNQAPITNATEVNTSLAGAQRAPAGTLSGEDFASFLRNQIRALKQHERQDIAAAPLPPPPTRTPSQTAIRQVRDDADRIDGQADTADNAARADATEAKNLRSQAAQDKQDLAHAQDRMQDTTDAVESESAKQSRGAQTQDKALNQADAQASAQTTRSMATDEGINTPQDTHEATNTLPAQLTTIPLSPSINIITTAQSQPDDQSVADFALAMGLDPSQVQALFGPSAATNAPAQNVSTQQMLAMNSLPSFNAPLTAPEGMASPLNLPLENLNLATAVSTADFQELQATAPTSLDASANNTLNALSNLNIQIATAQLTPNATPAMPVSTLAVLSMMDTELRAEDIDALKTEFDALSPTDMMGSGSGEHGAAAASSTHANLPPKAATVLANNPNMAQTFDKLSEKLATELASRMNDQLNAGEWKMKFALKPASLGLVDVQLEMRDGRLTAQFNADTSLTQDLIQNGSQKLKEALGQLGMNNASVLVGQGQTQQQSQPGQSGQSGMPGRRDDNRVTLTDEAAPELATTARPRHSNSLQFDNYA